MTRLEYSREGEFACLTDITSYVAIIGYNVRIPALSEFLRVRPFSCETSSFTSQPYALLVFVSSQIWHRERK